MSFLLRFEWYTNIGLPAFVMFIIGFVQSIQMILDRPMNCPEPYRIDNLSANKWRGTDLDLVGRLALKMASTIAAKIVSVVIFHEVPTRSSITFNALRKEVTSWVYA